MTKFLSLAVLIGLISLGTSCSKDDDSIPQQGNNDKPSTEDPNVPSGDDVITLTIPAMPGFGDEWSNIITGDDVTDSSVGWKMEDKIFIGSIGEDVEDNTSLQTLIDKGDFSTFTCSAVNNDGTAVFNGTKIPENANIAVYTGQPKYVFKTVKDGQVALKASCIAMAPTDDNDLGHISKNDFLVAVFDRENNSVKEFGRIFAIGKFEITLADLEGPFDKFVSIKDDGIDYAMPSVGLIMPYALDESGFARAENAGGVFVIDCSNLSVNDNKLTIYSLLCQQQINGKKLKFGLQKDRLMYMLKEVDANKDIISPDMAIKFELEYIGEPPVEIVGTGNNIYDFSNWTEWK